VIAEVTAKKKQDLLLLSRKIMNWSAAMTVGPPNMAHPFVAGVGSSPSMNNLPHTRSGTWDFCADRLGIKTHLNNWFWIMSVSLSATNKSVRFVL